MKVLADACQASHQLKIAVATLLGVTGAAAMNEHELTASLTDSIVKLPEDQQTTQTTIARVQKLLSANKTAQEPPRQQESKPTSVTVRHELKMNFTSYTSIRRQMEGAVKKGYSEQEIQDALLNSVPADLPLKQYLEVARLDLQGTCRLIQQHFKEPSATELFTELTNASQNSDETAVNFVMRMMDKRERIKLAASGSKEPTYPDNLVDTTYHQVLVAGLVDVEMRITVRRLVEQKATDDEIIAQLNKLSSQLKAPKLCEELKANNESEMQGKKRPREAEETFEQMNAKIQALEAELKSKTTREQFEKYKCGNCKKYNRQRCNHCWRCGSDSHLQRDCRRTQGSSKNQGNDNRPR